MNEMKERLREPLHWFPYPFFLPFALILVFTAHIFFAINPRMGNPADILTFPAETHKDGPFWLSVTPIGDDVVVTTGDRKVFRWSQNVRSVADLHDLTEYLKKRVEDELLAVGLVGKASKSQTSAVLAVDQRLKYLHIRPIIYALAEAKITHYSFETNNPVLATVHDDQKKPDSSGHGHVQE
jgi:hypothetical protein